MGENIKLKQDDLAFLFNATEYPLYEYEITNGKLIHKLACIIAENHFLADEYIIKIVNANAGHHDGDTVSTLRHQLNKSFNFRFNQMMDSQS